MRLANTSGVVLTVVLGAAIWGQRSAGPMLSMSAATQTSERVETQDPYQRSLDHFLFRASAASGPQRGEELYFYKCWFCHSALAERAPVLEDLFDRPGVTRQHVAQTIRQGGPGMPAYRHTLGDADIADLLSYLRSDTCCWEGEEPPPQPRYRMDEQAARRAPAAWGGGALRGGAHGVVRVAAGGPVEGIGVQLISARTAIRTTVYTNADGQFEFPVLEPGPYTLRVPRPMEFKPYVREGVQIAARTPLPEIALERVSDTYLLPPTPEILAQLTGSEWMLNLSGTGEEKRVFTLGCGMGCHSYQQVFRNRYDEQGWELILQRMLRSGSSTLFGSLVPTETTMDRAGRPMLEDEALLATWLARVRGPDSTNAHVQYLPRERGRSTRVVVTEYELPRELLAPHDVHGDADGNIWYTAHRSPYVGVLDPDTGVVTEHRIPDKAQATPGALPGTHRVWIDNEGLVWFSEGWASRLTALDPRSGQVVRRFDQRTPEGQRVFQANFAMDAEGYAYTTRGQRGGGARVVAKTDGETGEVVQQFPLRTLTTYNYDNIVTPDGRYWAGGAYMGHRIGRLDTQTGEVWEADTPTKQSNPARGAFDLDGNGWLGGRGGMLIKIDPKARRITEYPPPIPYDTFYEVMPDKNGEIWAGGLQSGRFWRFDPTTEQWTGYMMPEPYAHDRRTWIDNATDPVTVWYVDHNGYMVRIQPLD